MPIDFMTHNELFHSPKLAVYVYTAAQVKKALEVHLYRYSTKLGTRSVVFSESLFIVLRKIYIAGDTLFGGRNYVFSAGREGFQSHLNKDMERDLAHLVRESFYP